MHMKGQWFIVGAITLITMMVVVAVGRTQVQIGQNIEPWQKYAFQNLKAESPSAINAMIRNNATSDNVEKSSRDYLDFLRSFGDARSINVSAYFIVGLPAESGVNVSIINFARSELQNIAITLNGTTKTIPSIADRNSTTVAFANVPDYFTLNYTLAEVNATGGTEMENGTHETTKKVFSFVMMRVESKDKSQLWQSGEWQ